MLNIVSSNRFKKDLKLVLRRGYRIELLEEVVNKLAGGIVLEPKYILLKVKPSIKLGQKIILINVD